MPPAPYAESLRRFARDLGALRETRGVGIERIHQQSKIPLHVLKDFEGDALLGNPVFNRVYLRSLVKTYADALRLPAADVMSALERAYAGQYDGLGTLGGPPPAAAETPAEATDAPAETADDAREAPAKTALSVPPTPEGGTTPTPSARQVAPAYSTVQPGTPTTPAGQAFAGTYGSYVEPRRLPGWAPVLLGVIGLLAIIGGIVWWLSRSPSAGTAPERSDSTATAAPPSTATPAPAARPAPAPQTLPDTLVLTVRAATAPLRGIRVRLDSDDRRPYWIEQGEERTFRFRDSAFVTSRPPAAAFLLNGAPLDTATVRAPDGSLRITRARLTGR